MENASKALIIAGAILLAILIIGLGMFIFTQAKGAIGNANLDPQKVEAYNSQFEQYEGTKSGSEARSLYNLIRTHNNGNIDDPTLQIALTIDGGDLDQTKNNPASDTPITLPANTLKAGKTYNITFQVDPNSGFITKCNIQDKSKAKTE